jgi:asparagine synthase (glutamine-hydrolysing)
MISAIFSTNLHHPVAPHYQRITWGSWVIDFCVEQPYGFYLEVNDSFVIGESTARINKDEIAAFLSIKPESHPMDRMPDLLASFVAVARNAAEPLLGCNLTSCRPIFWAYVDSRLIVSSSLRQLRQAGVKLELNHAALPEFAAHRVVVPPRTLYCGISRVPPGQLMHVNVNGASVKEIDHWSFPRKHQLSRVSRRDVLEHVEHLLIDHTRGLLADSAKPLALLSGGIDSTLMTILAKKLRSDLDSASTNFSFANKHEKEEEYATTASNHLGVPHRVFKPNGPEYLRGLVKAIELAEEPVEHLQSVLLHLLFAHFSKGVHDTCLNGQFADGLFDTHKQVLLQEYRSLTNFLSATGLNRLGRRLCRSLGIDGFRPQLLLADLGDEQSQNEHFLFSIGAYANPKLVSEALGCRLEDVIAPRREFLAVYGNESIGNKLSILHMILVASFMTRGIWSKLSEASGLRQVFPFASTELANYVTSLPWSARGGTGKAILSALLRRHGVPDSLINRPKLGFGFPYRFWALPNTLFQPLVDMAGEMFDPKLLASLQVEDRSRANLLWNLLNVYLWRKLFEQQVSADDLAEEVLRRHDHLKHKAAAT